jgi:phosphatidylglycerophosphatase A
MGLPVEKPRFLSAGSLTLWIAQGFGLGWIPFAPGTFGSVLGIFWFALLLLPGRLDLLLAGAVLGLALSVWLCGKAEKILGKTDPGCVVLDEVAAIPFCFLGWACFELHRTGVLPGCGEFLSGNHWPLILLVFAAFRFFDIAKPWPVRQSQVLPGGWGITIDDFLASFYVNAMVLVAWVLQIAAEAPSHR